MVYFTLKFTGLFVCMVYFTLKFTGLSVCMVYFTLKFTGLSVCMVYFTLKFTGLSVCMVYFTLKFTGLYVCMVYFTLKFTGLSVCMVYFTLKFTGLSVCLYGVFYLQHFKIIFRLWSLFTMLKNKIMLVPLFCLIASPFRSIFSIVPVKGKPTSQSSMIDNSGNAVDGDASTFASTGKYSTINCIITKSSLLSFDDITSCT